MLIDFLKLFSVHNGSIREMKGFYECLMSKFASNMTVPFHCVPEFLGTSNDGKLFLDKTSSCLLGNRTDEFCSTESSVEEN